MTGANLKSYIGGLSFDGSTVGGICTYKDADEITVQTNLTYSSDTLTFVSGSDSTIKKPAAATTYKLTVKSGEGLGVNKNGANLILTGGAGTGTGTGGHVVIKTAKSGTSGSTVGTYGDTMTIMNSGEIRTVNPNTTIDT